SLIAAVILPGLPRKTAASNDGHHCVHSCAHSAIAVTGLNSRDDHLVDDARCHGIRNHRFETIAHFEPEFPISRHDKEYEPVIDAFPAYFPLRKCPHSPVFDRCITCRLADVNDELMTC